jgi:hypothetical protein
MFFFNPKEFTIVDSLPQDTSFTTAYFVTNVILPLAGPISSAAEDISRYMLHLHFNNSTCHTARHVQEQMASLLCVRVPHPRIHLTWPSQTSNCLADESSDSWRTLDSEENVLGMITEILSEAREDEMTDALVHWKERRQRVADHNSEFCPN